MKTKLFLMILLLVSLTWGQWIYEDLIVSIPDDDYSNEDMKFGTSDYALDTYDLMDRTAPPAPPSGGYSAFIIDDTLVQHVIIDFRRHDPAADTVLWLIYIRSGEMSSIITWNNTTLPDHPSTSIEIAAHYPGVTPLEDDYIDMLTDTQLNLMPAQYATIRFISIDGVKEEPAVQVPTSLITSISPNPFNARTSVNISLSEAADIEINVYDLIGNRIKALSSGHVSAGDHSIKWDGTNDAGMNMPTGVYFIKINSDDIRECHRIVYMK